MLDDPGTADLSVWVDFGALRQAAEESGAAVACVGPVSQVREKLRAGPPLPPWMHPFLLLPNPGKAVASGVRPSPLGPAHNAFSLHLQASFLRGLGVEARLEQLTKVCSV